MASSKNPKSPGPDAALTRPLRVEPQQDRARAQIAKIELAAQEVLRSKGRDEFTTADIAAVAKVSIGTIYRYFPDRVAILDHVWPGRRDTLFPGAATKD